jgi:hypothetical protein
MLRFFLSFALTMAFALSQNSFALGIQDRVSTLILTLLNDEVHGTIDAESFEFSAPSTITFNKVSIKDVASKQLLFASRLKARLNLTDLFSGVLTFEEIEAISPRFDVEIVKGKLDFLSLFKSGSKKSKLIFKKVIIRDGEVSLKDTDHLFRLQRLNLESGPFDSEFTNITMKQISGFLSAGHLPVSGELNGTLNISGIDSLETKFSFSGAARSLKLFSRHLDASNIDVSLLFSGDTLQFQTIRLSSPELSLDAKGYYLLRTDQINLSVNANLAKPAFIFPNLDPIWLTSGTSLKGTLKGSIDAPTFQTDLTTQWQDSNVQGTVSYDVKTASLNGTINLVKEDEFNLRPLIGENSLVWGTHAKVIISGTLDHIAADISGRFSRVRAPNFKFSAVNASFASKGTFNSKTKAMAGDLKLTLQNAQIQDFALSNTQIAATIAGGFDAPTIQGSIRSDKVHSKWIDSDKLEGLFAFQNKEFLVSNFNMNIQKGALKLRSLAVNTSNQTIKGEGSIEHLDITRAFTKPLGNSKGNLDGMVLIAGSLKQPKISLDARISPLTLLGEELGNVDILANYGQVGPDILQVSAGLHDAHGKADLRASFDARSETLNGLLDFSDIQFDPVLDLVYPWLKFGSSSLSGQLQMKGSIHNPDAVLSLLINADRADPQMNLLGMQIGATLSNTKFSFGGCANVYHQYQETDPCMPAVPIKMKGEGSIRSLDDFSLHYNARIKSDNFEKISEFLKRESIGLDMKLEVDGSLEKKPGKEIENKVSATFQEINAFLPDDLNVKLEKPFVLKWAKNDMTIEPKAHFLLKDGELILGGQFSSDRVAAEFDGRIPLYLARIFNRNIVEASGLAVGNVVLSGSLDKPFIKGSLRPDKGSYFRFRALPANVEFESGELLAGLDNSDRRLIHIDVDKLNLKIGNGALFLNGYLDFDRLADKQEDVLRHVDLEVKGTDLSTTLREFAIEGDLNLKIQTQNSSHWIRGDARIGSGKLVKEFNLDGFEISAVSTAPTAFTWPAFFNRFKLAIDMDLSPFDLEADFGPFEFAGSIVGNDLRITGDLVQARVFGSLQLTEGLLKFPMTDFDIPTTPIALRNTPGKTIDPDIHIKATGEINTDLLLDEYRRNPEANRFTNTSIELSLDGDLDHLNLDLSSNSGSRQLDRPKILAILLNMNLGPEILLRPLIAKLEELLKTRTKTRFRIASSFDESGFKTTLNWRLNSRFEIGGSSSTQQLGLENVHFKLNLFDHLPIGKELSFEGIFSFLSEEKGAQNFQINYRLFEK